MEWQPLMAQPSDNSEHLVHTDQTSDPLDQLRALTSYLQGAREEDRSRIARAIHDDLGQALTVLKIDLAWLKGRLARESQNEWVVPLLEKAESMSALMDNTVQMVRRIATDLRPGVLDNLGLVAALEWQAQDFQKHSGIPCRLATDLQDLDLDPHHATAAFRICQEALTNVARHAGATEVCISLEKDGASLLLEVADNGRGITEEETRHGCSLGILGMRERAALVGGVLHVGGRVGRGTSVTIWMPVAGSTQRPDFLPPWGLKPPCAERDKTANGGDSGSRTRENAGLIRSGESQGCSAHDQHPDCR
jgi:signal transduction histidine kinase